MRAVLVAVLFAAAACEGQLNPEWCSTHPDDQDCINAGLVQVDAAPSCKEVACASPEVCDTNRGGGLCVECVPGNPDNPQGCFCASDDRCHGCLTNTDCGPGGICLPDMTCIGGGGGSGSGSSAPDNLLYASPTPGETADCSMANPCAIKTALTKLDTTHHVIELAAGTYDEGTITIGANAILIGPLPGAGHQYQDPTDATGRAVISGGDPVITITGGVVGLYELTIAGSQNDAGIRCNAATLELYHSVVRDNAHEGVTAASCSMTIERSAFTANGTTGSTFEGIYADSCNPIAIRNNFIYGNGNNTSTKGAVHFHGATVGDFRFNTVAYNNAGPKPKSPNAPTPVGGLLNESTMVIIRDDILSKNATADFGYIPNVSSMPQNTYLGGDPKLKSPTDLHATAATPAPAIINNSASDCSKSSGYDIDYDVRPNPPACDLGADEL